MPRANASNLPVSVRTSPYTIQTARKIPDALLTEGAGARSVWPFKNMKVKQFIIVPREDKDRAMMSATQTAKRNKVAVPDPNNPDGAPMEMPWRFAATVNTDKDGNEITETIVIDEDTGETKTVPKEYIIMRVR